MRVVGVLGSRHDQDNDDGDTHGTSEPCPVQALVRHCQPAQSHGQPEFERCADRLITLTYSRAGGGLARKSTYTGKEWMEICSFVL